MPRDKVIALLTDFGLEDNYVGTMKAVIAVINPGAGVIDVTHGVRPQDITGGAFMLSSSYKYFPEGAIFVVVVDPGVGGERRVLCAQTGKHIFLAPDNGVLGSVLSEESEENVVSLVEVSNPKFFLPDVSGTFHGRDIFAPVAAHLSLGVNPARLGPRINEFKRLDVPGPVNAADGTLSGEVIYVDRFGNLITNIDRARIEAGDARVLSVTIGKKEIEGLSATYSDGRPGETLALIGSSGYLEIAENCGNACESLGCSRGEKVTVRFNKG